MSTTTPARVALGLAALAAERVRANAPGGDVLATTVGLLEETGQAVRAAAGQMAAPTARAATIGLHQAARLPGASRVRDPAQRAFTWVRDTAAAARERGQETVTASRADAAAVVRSTVDDGIGWLVPRILQRSLPEVRARLLPVVIEQFTTDPRVHEFLTEQARLLVGRALDQVNGRDAAVAR